jgi:hypothetical protein
MGDPGSLWSSAKCGWSIGHFPRIDGGSEAGPGQGGVTREQVVEGLRPLLALPVEVVLPAHGAPTDRAGLERALS